MPPEQTCADYLDGALSAEETAALEAALLHDRGALRTVVEQQRIEAGLRSLLDTRLQEQLRQGILSDIAAASETVAKKRVLGANATWDRRRRVRAQEWWIAAASLAAAACFVLLIHALRPKDNAPANAPSVAHVPATPSVPENNTDKKSAPDTAPMIGATSPSPPVLPKAPEAPPPTPPVIPKQAVVNNDARPVMPPVAPVPPLTPTPPPAAPQGTSPPVMPNQPPLIVSAALRNLAEQPFASDSPWNTPIGANAVYAPILLAQKTPNTDVDRIGIRTRPILREDAGGPRYQLMAGGNNLGDFHLTLPPDRFRGNDQPVCVIDTATRRVVELGNADFTQAGVIVGEQGATVELPGSGFGGGISDSGGSALGGVVRNGELVGGIHHALSMAVIMMGLSGNTGGKDPWVWPATSAPFYAKKYFPKRGNVPIGALLAIPPTVKIENLGVGGPGTPGWELARAMQDYGVYVTNACKIQQYHFYFEGGNLPANLSDILLRLSRQLHVVKNNSPATPGGGGKPRRDPTPPSAK